MKNNSRFVRITIDNKKVYVYPAEFIQVAFDFISELNLKITKIRGGFYTRKEAERDALYHQFDLFKEGELNE